MSYGNFYTFVPWYVFSFFLSNVPYCAILLGILLIFPHPNISYTSPCVIFSISSTYTCSETLFVVTLYCFSLFPIFSYFSFFSLFFVSIFTIYV